MSYLPLSVASEVRYHFWTMTGIAIASVIILSDARTIPKRRLVGAFMPLFVVMLLCVAARI